MKILILFFYLWMVVEFFEGENLCLILGFFLSEVSLNL